MKKVEAIIRAERLQAVQDVLDELGISGLTVTEVMGCGRQKGYTEQYRGSRANISLLPKLKVESVVSSEIVDKAVDAIVGAAYTGETGDGRVFVYDAEGYAFRLGVRAGFGGQETARIPVRRRPNPAPHPILKEIHECEVAGQPLEAANLYALRAKVARLLEGIAPGRSLPLCYFRVAAMDYELPVYEDDGELTSPVICGPNLRANDMAGIRRLVCRY